MTNEQITFTMKELKEIYKKSLERLNNEIVLNQSLKYELATKTLEKHDLTYKRLEMQLNAFLNELDNPNYSTLEIERINAKIDMITDKQLNIIDELMKV